VFQRVTLVTTDAGACVLAPMAQTSYLRELYIIRQFHSSVLTFDVNPLKDKDVNWLHFDIQI